MSEIDLNVPGVLARRYLDDGRILDVTLLTFGRARLHVGPPDSHWYDDEW